MQTTLTVPTTLRDLTALGFSQQEIQRLETLKSSYDPFRESCETNRMYKQLCFLKWHYEHGEIKETSTE